MLTKTQLDEIKNELDNCSNPVFLYDNDADGLCSFLLFYKYKGEGKGFRHPKNITDEIEMENIKRMGPDKVFILDVPASKITQDFIDGLKVPVIHVEHHITENKLKKIKTFNPTIKKKSDNPPTSSICYNVVKENLWIAAIGTVSDWQLTKETKQFAKEYPDLLNPKMKDPAEAKFESKIGLVGRIINFVLKGKSADVRKSINNLMKIKDPYEILEQKTNEGKWIFKRYNEIDKSYKALYERAIKHVTKDNLLYFPYEEEDISFSAEISNELVYRYPKKVVFVARKKKGIYEAEMRCSIRSATTEIRSKLLKALEGVDGHGGGHPRACGASIKAKDFDKFLEQFKEQI